MKKFLFILPVLFISSLIYAMQVEPVRQYAVERILNSNPGFENGKSSWTASGGSFTISVSNPATGNAMAAWDSNGAAQTLTSTAVSIPPGAYGKNGVASAIMTCASTSCTHTLQAYDGTNILASTTITSNQTVYVRTSVNFVFPISGSISIRIVSVASNEPNLFIDDAIIGLADGINLSQVSQASLFGAVTSAPASSCSWSSTSATYAAFSADTDCSAATASGNASAPSTKIPAIRFANGIPPGTYMIVARGLFQTTGTTPQCSYQFTDGTNTFGWNSVGTTASVRASQMTGIVTYTGAQGDTTIQIHSAAYAGTGTPTCVIENDTTTFERFDIDVYRFPSTSDLGLRIDQVANVWSGFHSNDCSWARTNTSLGDPTADASCTFTQGTNTNFGTVASYVVANNEPGIVWNPSKAGTYLVCATTVINGAGAAGTNLGIELSDLTPTVIAFQEPAVNVAGQPQPVTLCGLYAATSTAAQTVRLRSSASTGAITIAASTTLGHSVDWTIMQVVQNLPMPLLVGGVVTNNSGVSNELYANLNCDASSAITSQSGTTANGVATVGNVSTGVCAGTFAGMWSGTPICVANNQGSTLDSEVRIHATSSTAFSLYCITPSTGAALASCDASVFCTGPK